MPYIYSTKINNIDYLLTTPLASCETDAITQEKVVTLNNSNITFALITGIKIVVKFTYANTAPSPTLNVNNTGAKPIYLHGGPLTSSLHCWAASQMIEFIYDGNYWQMLGAPQNNDTDTQVTQTARTTNGEFPILLRGTSAGTTSITATASFASAVTINPSTGVLSANDFYTTATNHGYYAVDSNGTTYRCIGDNGSDLWIGASETAATHHTGNTIISAGYNDTSSSGNESIYVCVPNSSNNGGSNYLVLHANNYSNYAVPLSGGTITGDLALNGNLNITSGNHIGGDLNFDGDVNFVSDLTLENGSWITFKNSTGNGGVNMYQESPDDSTPKLSLYGAYADEAVILDGIATPTNDSEAANKAYVDSTLASGNAGSATKLATARYIDGVKFDGSANVTRYATCSTAAATAAKTASITAGTFNLATGARVTVRFTYANTASSPTLNVGGTGAKSIYWHNSALPSSQYWSAYSTLDFVYTGSAWELVGVANDNNTTYVKATTSKDGLMPKLSGVSTEYLRGDGQWATVSSSSGGMIREFYTGKISVTTYTTSTNLSKIYTVTLKDSNSRTYSIVVDYKTVQYCKDSANSFQYTIPLYASNGLSIAGLAYLNCTFNSGGTITFTTSNTLIKIIQICGFY